MLALLLAALLAVPPGVRSLPSPIPDSPAAEARRVVQSFLEACRGVPPLGIPGPRDLDRLRPYLSHGLQDDLDAAARWRDAEAQRAPDEKPPFVDGDLFTSNFEGFTTFRMGPVTSGDDGGFRVAVTFTYEPPAAGGPGAEPPTPGAKPAATVTWTDVFVVLRDRGALAVDDVVYGADWPFANHGRLRAALRAR